LNIRNRVDDIYSSYQYLIKEKYTSPGKVAFIGRQFGASALLDMFNRHNLNTPAVLVDGVYDFVDYNSHGRLLFHNNKVFNAQDSISFRKIYNVSPYHQVKAHKSYPPLLFMVSDKKDLIPEDQTYRLAAKLQMRTKADNPVLLLTPRYVENLEGYDRYTYKMFIEYGMLFIMDQLDIPVN
ncbi:MAG: prolyl oligopeptidase family serine peptidase, partial [Bacteroidales bacterium]